MKISIVTVCYNSEATIRDTIESVLAQDYPNIEYIVVDGESKDRTMDIVREYEDRIAVVVSEPDAGIYDAMNKGIRLATGDVFGILNSDDFFSSTDSISAIASGFSEDNVDAVYGDLIYVSPENTDKTTRFYSVKRFTKTKIRMGIMPPHPTFYVKRKFFEQLGYYKTDYRVSADFELVSRFWLQGVHFYRVPKVIVTMREGGISSSGLAGRIHQNKEIVRACRENGIKTNLAVIGLKIPFKLISKLKRAPKYTMVNK
ncbi:glycosyl transferase [Aliidiomarina minuta]|uniref:Glycosyl transferase n=1 Tax=Aliidiomarina minuta TaxID=880057 RepID=A0A432W9I6_9GAMM|nr:glycosyltransferase family 2 protein [Aliidiomarina minuta]RUO26258.1 glycosyl transferase [Aliidiomarina minuta]